MYLAIILEHILLARIQFVAGLPLSCLPPTFLSYDLSGFSKAAAYWYRSWWLAAIPETRDDRPPIGPQHQVHVVQNWIPPPGAVQHQANVIPCVTPLMAVRLD